MEAWFLRQWQTRSLWQVLLRPPSWLFALLSSVRRGLYQIGWFTSHQLPVPVIVVGNISVGGTGKTPLVLAIVECLNRHGRHCGIVSRGYSRERKANSPAVVEVTAADSGGVAVGDEALLLARRTGVPVYAGIDRVAAARALLAAHPAIDVLVCDDGLQHYALRRDLELCVVDAARGFGNGELLPAGPLRESPARLATVDAIVVNGEPAAAPGFAASPVPRFAMQLGNPRFVHLSDSVALDSAAARAQFDGKRVHAVAGIGHPQRFFDHLAALAIVPLSTRALADHHAFSVADFAAVDADIILMTEKDAVKCEGFADSRLWFMRVDAILADGFGAFLLQQLSTGNNHVDRSETA